MSYRINTIVLEGVSVFLLHRPGEAILIDSGRRGSAPRIISKMKQFGIEPSMLKWLILTHSHFDHAGSARKLKELTDCKIAIHSSEAHRLKRGTGPIPAGSRPKARRLSILGKVFMPWIMWFQGVEADLEIAGDCSLEAFGFPGKIIHTPGHTPGSLVILLPEGKLVAGDTLIGLDNKQHFPAFAEDIPALLESWKQIKELPVERIYPSHGPVFKFRSFLDEYPKAVERYSELSSR